MTTLQIVILVLVIFAISATALVYCIRAFKRDRWWHCDDCGIYFSNSGDSAVEPPTNQHVEHWAVKCDACLCDALYHEKHKHENNHS